MTFCVNPSYFICARKTNKHVIYLFKFVFIVQIPGGTIEDSKVLTGVMLNKDITHQRMRRRIENPRIMLLDCSLEYKKGESQVRLLSPHPGDPWAWEKWVMFKVLTGVMLSKDITCKNMRQNPHIMLNQIVPWSTRKQKIRQDYQ